MFLRTGMGMLVLGAVLLAGCSSDHSKLSPAAGSDRVIRGSISYREHITLPAAADIDIWLNDTTPGYNIMMVTAETTIATAGRQVPIPFELRYDPSRIAAGHTYGLRATIRSGGEMLFTTNEATPVLVPDKSSKSDLMLVAAVRPPTDRAGTGFTGSAWRLEDLAGADVVPNAEATLEFPEAGKVVGKGTCNRFFGTVAISGQTMTFGPIGATKMACLDEKLGDQEGKYFKALEGAERFTLEGDVLMVYVKGLDKPLRFVRKTS